MSDGYLYNVATRKLERVREGETLEQAIKRLGVGEATLVGILEGLITRRDADV